MLICSLSVARNTSNFACSCSCTISLDREKTNILAMDGDPSISLARDAARLRCWQTVLAVDANNYKQTKRSVHFSVASVCVHPVLCLFEVGSVVRDVESRGGAQAGQDGRGEHASGAGTSRKPGPRRRRRQIAPHEAVLRGGLAAQKKGGDLLRVLLSIQIINKLLA
jgi:hypothetical protein